jgi:hypothetical protein
VMICDDQFYGENDGNPWINSFSSVESSWCSCPIFGLPWDNGTHKPHMD